VRLPFAARNSDPESTSAYFSKGEKPADLLLIQSTEFDLVIHLTTPEADGLAIVPCCLLRRRGDQDADVSCGSKIPACAPWARMAAYPR